MQACFTASAWPRVQLRWHMTVPLMPVKPGCAQIVWVCHTMQPPDSEPRFLAMQKAVIGSTPFMNCIKHTYVLLLKIFSFFVRVYLMSHRYCSNCVSGVGGILPDHLSGCMWCTICVVCDTVPAKWVGYGLCKKCHGWMCGDCNKKSHDSICNSALCVPKSKK